MTLQSPETWQNESLSFDLWRRAFIGRFMFRLGLRKGDPDYEKFVEMADAEIDALPDGEWKEISASDYADEALSYRSE